MAEDALIAVGQLIASIASLGVAILTLPLTLFQGKGKSPRSILITGASSGIGEALALKYAKQGIFLALTGRNQERLNRIADACRKLGAEVECGIVDVTDAEALEKFILTIDESHALDLVIANAGVSGGVIGHEVEFGEKTKKIFDINVYGVFNTLNPILPKLRDRGSGQVAVVASLSGFYDLPRSVAYSSSKAALITYCQGLRGVMKPHNVGVTVICPGYVETNFTKFSHSQGRSTPFLMNSEQAATLITTRLEYNPPTIAFPLQMFILTFVLRILPPRVHDLFANLLGIQSKPIPWNRIG